MWETLRLGVSVLSMNVWDVVKEQLQTRVSAESYQNWVSRTVFRQIENNTVRVLVPDEQTREWLESQCSSLISPVLQNLNLAGVTYEVAGVTQPGPSSGSRYGEGFSHEMEFESTASQLNPKFTFDSFVVGACNQFAHAAARAVATSPSRTYNPLFIYGGVGMGKTHLMHAIGRALVDRYTGMRIVYTSSERFMNEMITCIRLDRMPQFHRYYRAADALLVDDIQILGNKERTQEEFFHTFNELYDHQKQIVISSDSPPKDIPGLVDRLRSRFEWGLMVDMQPPDLETKMAILDKKAEAEGIRLPEDVRTFLATKTKSNVRELEGALVKLLAYSSLTGAPINLAMAHQELGHFETALQVSKQLLHIDPDNAPALNFVGYILAEHGRELGRSEALIRKALAKEPKNGYYVDSLGWVFYRKGEYSRAASELERAVQLTEEHDATILEHLGDAYVKMGHLDGAYRVYNLSHSIDPENPAVGAKLESVAKQLGKP